MIQIRETTRHLRCYRPVPLTNLPLIYHREHLFPCTSYGDTETTPVPRTFRTVVLESAALRIEVGSPIEQLPCYVAVNYLIFLSLADWPLLHE